MTERLPLQRRARQRLVVAGGGLAGWLAAAFLQRVLRRAGWSVTVVAPRRRSDSDLAVATGPDFTRLLHGLGIDEETVLRRCQGTYRLASRFTDWFAPGRSHLLPFGPCGPRPGGHDLFHYWLKDRIAGADGLDYGAHSLVAQLAEHGFGPLGERGRSPVQEEGDYGFHLAAAPLLDMLRDIALVEGVRWIEARVSGAEISAGTVRCLRLRDGDEVEGDHFIDATGTAAVLIGEALGQGREPGAEAAFAIRRRPIDGATDPRPVTRYRALPTGYSETIPLADIAIETTAETGMAADADRAHLQAGFRKDIWAGNVVALGRAAGGLPPLLGLDGLLLLRSLERFLEWLPRGIGEPGLCEAFNHEIGRDVAAAEEVVRLHLGLGRRIEPFWSARRADALSPALQRRLDLYETAGRIEPMSANVFDESAYYHTLVAAQLLPRRVFAPVDLVDPRQVAGLLTGVREQNEQMLRGMLSHARTMDAIHGARTGSPEGSAVAPEQIALPNAVMEMRATAGGRTLFDLVTSLDKPFGIERSVKAEAGRLQRERFLTSLHRSALGDDAGAVVGHFGAALGLAEPYRSEAMRAIPSADILHLGYEDGANGPLYKLYVEWSTRADRIWHHPEADPRPEPVLVHRAYKWDPAKPDRVVTTLYRWPHVRSAGDIRSRLPALGADAGGAFTVGLAEAVLDVVERDGTGYAHYLEVREDGSPRVSFDLNLYATGLSVGAFAPVIETAFTHLAVPLSETRRFVDLHRQETLGHVAGGLGRRGEPFVTVYFGAREA
ncbi:tryptophan 7-halogenase [uncultured Bosea sp.]|uniref:tryptophan 7-halogenase n=1 Tax=uncultured Bosea sp. TaxID=211457 RepID=UPI0025D627B4|nr:tryptophan 7-halogenase [uncultured Bosea sp.]